MDILDRVPGMRGQRVRIGSGTLYSLLEQFLEADMIRETGSQGRKRRYVLTPKGEERLAEEYRRLCAQIQDFQRFFLAQESIAAEGRELYEKDVPPVPLCLF